MEIFVLIMLLCQTRDIICAQYINPYGSAGMPFGSVGLPYGSVGMPYGSLGMPYGSVGMPFGSVGMPYGSVGMPFGSVGTPFGSAVDSKVSTYDIHPENDENGLGFVECGTRTVEFIPRRSAKIVGGVESPYGAFPWQVEIKQLNAETNAFEHHCGGAVVGVRTVVTAAHCFGEPLKIDNFRVVTGEHRLKIRDPHEHSFRIKRVISHPDFRKSGPHSNDIAVISVGVGPGGIPFSSHVRPICLPSSSLPQGPCSVSGWGALHEGIETLSPVLRAAAVPLVDHDTCRQLGVYGGRQQPILDTMICAGLLQGGIDACGGDSGGPLACQNDGRFELTGLVSWGDGCGKKNRPGVYTKVQSFNKWIRQTMSEIEN